MAWVPPASSLLRQECRRPVGMIFHAQSQATELREAHDRAPAALPFTCQSGANDLPTTPESNPAKLYLESSFGCSEAPGKSMQRISATQCHTDAKDPSNFFTSLAARLQASRDAVKQARNQDHCWNLDMPSPAIKHNALRVYNTPRARPHRATVPSNQSRDVTTAISTTVAPDMICGHTCELGDDASAPDAQVCHDPVIAYYLIGLVGNRMQKRIASKLREVEDSMQREVRCEGGFV